jgi:hypothetical protein
MVIKEKLNLLQFIINWCKQTHNDLYPVMISNIFKYNKDQFLNTFIINTWNDEDIYKSCELDYITYHIFKDNDNIEVLQSLFLLDQNPNIMLGLMKNELLYASIVCNRINCMNYLLDKFDRTDISTYALKCAIISNNIDIVTKIFDIIPFSKFNKNIFWRDIFIKDAFRFSSYNIVMYLLSKFTNINIRNNIDIYFAHALENANIENVIKLYEMGAKITTKCYNKYVNLKILRNNEILVYENNEDKSLINYKKYCSRDNFEEDKELCMNLLMDWFPDKLITIINMSNFE